MFLKIIIDSIRFATILLFGSAGETVTEKTERRTAEEEERRSAKD